VPPHNGPIAPTEQLLDIRQLSKSFGEFPAVSGMSLQVMPAEIHAIIGPNGAGKTTLLNLISGTLAPNTGDILFKGQSIREIAPHQLGALSVARSFQITSIITKFSVFRNVQLALLARAGRCRNLISWRQMRNETLGVLELMDLRELSDNPAGTLAAGDRKRLELAMALAINPILLLLDEPTAGMSPQERAAISVLLRRLNEDCGIAVLFIEHDIDMVFSTAHRVTVMHRGEKLCEGTPAAVRSDPRVREVYTGETAHAGV
jgi:branched-chain amino acid transport system ATP-binding protein